MSHLPLLLPGAAIAVVVSLAVSNRIGRELDTRRAVAAVMVLNLGLILAATLTPLREASPVGPVAAGSCDFSRFGLAPLGTLLQANDTLLNILMFVPLGTAIGFLPGSRRKAGVIVLAIALPFAIEMTQAFVSWLARACESADVIDNLTGLALGLVAGAAAARISPGARRSVGRPG